MVAFRSTIFPGMDPFLEDPQLWAGVHTSLIVYIRDQLQPRLGSNYIAAIEERVFVDTSPRAVVCERALEPAGLHAGSTLAIDADTPRLVRVPRRDVHETYVVIVDRRTGRKVVAVLEVVSPTNKFSGPGRVSYLDKQSKVLESASHLIEVDLLRGGPHVLAVPEWVARECGNYDNLVSVNRARADRAEFELYPGTLRNRLPKIRIPLSEGDPDVALDLQAVLNQAYEAARYREFLDYDAACTPPLAPDDQAWANSLIRDASTPGR